MSTETDIIDGSSLLVKLFKSLAPGRGIRLKIVVLYFACVGSAFSMEGIENECEKKAKCNELNNHLLLVHKKDRNDVVTSINDGKASALNMQSSCSLSSKLARIFASND